VTQSNSSPTRIVVGTDLSEAGDHALRQSVLLAKQIPGSELHVTHVIAAAPGLHDARKLEQLAADLPVKLEELRARVVRVCAPPADEPAFHVDCAFHVRLGQAAEELHQVAVDVEASLIVVGTRGRSQATELLLGSVAQRLLHLTHVSVLVAHPNELAKLSKSAQADVARPGQAALHKSLSHRVHLEFVPRNQHISGLL